MNTPTLPAWRRLPGLLLLLLALLAPAPSAPAASWTEPPLVLYGKVLNLGGGTAHQMYSGELHLAITSPGQPPQVLRLSTDLHAIGANREYSYRLTVPQFFQPGTNEQKTGVAAGVVSAPFTLEAAYAPTEASPVRIPVSYLDRAQLNALLLGQKQRAAEYRVDLVVAFPETDSDGDGMPDWWEDAYGLNKFSAADAGRDPDQDGLTNLREYLGGTDPNVANLRPIVQDTPISVPAGGRAGLALTVVDQDTSPAQIFLSYQNALPGLTWRLQGQPLSPGIEFTYQAVLLGQVTLEATPAFAGGRTQLRVRDGVLGNTNAPGDDSGIVQFNLQVDAVSPLLGTVFEPLLWLDAGTTATHGPTVGEWKDQSGAGRDAYQPSAPAQPLARDGRVRFEGGRFLYLDDRGLAAPLFTAFLAFDADSGSASQTVFRNADFQLDVQTASGVRHLRASQAGRTTLAPIAGTGSPALYTLTAGTAATQLEAPDNGAALSSAETNTLAAAFSSLGALYPLGGLAPSNYLQGNLREVVLYGAALPAAARARLQDYQLSRWEGFLVWDYRRATLPVRLAGRNDSRNALHGGYGHDLIVGGSKDDLISGGLGTNTLTGGAGADRFAFARTGSRDTITDFNAAEGDLVDLVDVVDATAGGLRPDITLRPVTTRGPGNVPRVDTIIEIRYAGPSAVVDQSITLQGVAYLPPSALRLPTVGTLPAPQIVDTVRPDVFVTAPAAGQVIRGDSATLTGRARDNRGVTLVYYSLNGGSWLNPITLNAWTNWNASLPLLPGTNTVLVFAVDAAGNRSLTNRLTFTSIQTAPLVQIIAGNGSVSPNYHNQSLEIGKAYTTTARAGAGYAFARWLDGHGTVLSENHALTFTMVRDLQLVAEFVPNPFPTLAGRYVGLYHATNGVTLTTSNAGFATLRVADTGSFNAQLQQGAQTWTFSGILSAGGKWSATALPSAPELAVSLQLDMTGAGVLSGVVTGPGGVLPLHTERAAYSAAKPAPQAGQYSLVLPAESGFAPAGAPANPPPSEPGGDGALAVNISAAGVVTVNGFLGDGTAVAQTTYLSQSGHWPLYGTPYSKKGVFLGWIQVRSGLQPAARAFAEASDMLGTVSWTKPGGTGSRLYPSGFSVMLGGVGQIFANRSPILEWTTGTLVLEGGNLSGPITNSVTMTPGGRGTGPNGLSLSITTTGLKGSLLSGQVRDPASGRTVTFKGAVLQKQGTGHGFFLGTNQSGRVTLSPMR